jgi:hypothetical protein
MAIFDHWIARKTFSPEGATLPNQSTIAITTRLYSYQMPYFRMSSTAL